MSRQYDELLKTLKKIEAMPTDRPENDIFWISIPKYEDDAYVIGFIVEKSVYGHPNQGGFRIVTPNYYSRHKTIIHGKNYELSAEEVIDYLKSVYENLSRPLVLEPV
jgi:hypothetical protein